MNGNSNPHLYQRRSLRIVLRVPLLINKAEPSPSTEWEIAETVVVSLHGGLIRTRQSFDVGATLDLRKPVEEISARARVVWSARHNRLGTFDVGFEILDQPGFWGVRFPPDRWPVRRETNSPALEPLKG